MEDTGVPVRRRPRHWVPALLLALLVGEVHADADPARGASAYAARCGACHSLDADRVGPRHAGLFGRRAGSQPGFAYSPSLQASTLVWDGAQLQLWLADPEALIPGQRMGYRLDDATVRADIVAYLRTATSPPTLPSSVVKPPP